MTKKIIAEPLAEVIAEYAEDVHLTYSGRGMSARSCNTSPMMRATSPLKP